MKSDQAAKLREIIQKMKKKVTILKPENSARIFTIASGKGGVGKTNIALNLAILLRNLKKKVLVIDGDLNLANLDILIGISPKLTMKDVVLGNKTINDIIIEGPNGISILPSPSGIIDFAGKEYIGKDRIIKEFSGLKEKYDIILIDTAAGIAECVLDFTVHSHEMIVVISPEPTSIMDAYVLIKLSTVKGNTNKVHIIVNQIKSLKEGKEAVSRIKRVAEKFLDVNLIPLGEIFYDINVRNAVKKQNAFVLEYPDSRASQCIQSIAEKLIADLKGSGSAAGEDLYAGDFIGSQNEKILCS